MIQFTKKMDGLKMLNLNLRLDNQSLELGVKILSKKYDYTIFKTGINVNASVGTVNEIIYDNKMASITYISKVDFFRCLIIFLENFESNDGNNFSYIEETYFKKNGAMFDCSRNAVLKVDSFKFLIENMAVMGMNELWIYMEDTYQIDGYPYFGYLRGRYTNEELKEIDDYANIFGIAVIPSIQTLSHLENFLKWRASMNLRDTERTLLADSEDTYDFIDAMLKTISKTFRSNKVHLGMDEAHFIGLGNYLTKNGYKDRFTVMNSHLNKVMAICRKYNIEPMIWSDMYFRLGSKNNGYYDLDSVIPASIISSIPDDLKIVYWDYYHDDTQFYIDFIKKHKTLGNTPVFAGGVWTWESQGTNYGKTFNTTNAALKACKKEKVEEVVATMWGGGDNNHLTSLLGLMLYAEHAHTNDITKVDLKKRNKFCTKIDYEAFNDLKYLDEIPGTKIENPDNNNPSKCLLWQDLLLGIFDRHLVSIDLYNHYNALENKFKIHMKNNEDYAYIFDVPHKLCKVLKTKSNLGVKIKKAYDEKNDVILTKIVNTILPKLKIDVISLMEANRKMWFRINKPFGWEIYDLRYGGLINRLDSVKERLNSYLIGEIDCIEELEQERLFYDGKNRNEKTSDIYSNRYFKMASPNSFIL